jgi:hypothetical protein
MRSSSLLILSLIFIASAASAFACPVAADGTPVCAYWTRADAVFLGKAVKVEDAPRNEDFPAGARKIRFQVLQNFKGADNPTFTVAVTDPLCGLKVKSGQTWIIYAGNDVVLKSFSAFRGVKIEPKINNAESDALKNILAGKSDTAIAGRFSSVAGNGGYAFEPVEISIAGNGKLLTAKTDADGAFNIAVPPDANYKVELKFPYRAGVNWNENLLGTSLTDGLPTLFKYEVRLNDGDCHFSFFEVIKRP